MIIAVGCFTPLLWFFSPTLLSCPLGSVETCLLLAPAGGHAVSFVETFFIFICCDA
jgi:hypothetical protein